MWNSPSSDKSRTFLTRCLNHACSSSASSISATCQSSASAMWCRWLWCDVCLCVYVQHCHKHDTYTHTLVSTGMCEKPKRAATTKDSSGDCYFAVMFLYARTCGNSVSLGGMCGKYYGFYGSKCGFPQTSNVLVRFVPWLTDFKIFFLM